MPHSHSISDMKLSQKCLRRIFVHGFVAQRLWGWVCPMGRCVLVFLGRVDSTGVRSKFPPPAARFPGPPARGPATGPAAFPPGYRPPMPPGSPRTGVPLLQVRSATPFCIHPGPHPGRAAEPPGRARRAPKLRCPASRRPQTAATERPVPLRSRFKIQIWERVS